MDSGLPISKIHKSQNFPMESNKLRGLGTRMKENTKQKISSDIKDSPGKGVFKERISGFSLSSAVIRLLFSFQNVTQLYFFIVSYT